jgi:DedD protein
MASRNSSAKQGASIDPALPQKKSARRRIIGAAAFFLAAAIILPIVLDSEPRQVRDDIQVRIPSRDLPLNEKLEGTTRQGVIVGAEGAGEVPPVPASRAFPECVMTSTAYVANSLSSISWRRSKACLAGSAHSLLEEE